MHEVNFELVGERIKLKRKAKKLTQDAVAEICGCSSKHLSAVENGEKPSIRYLSKLRGKTCAEKMLILYKKDICKCEACGGNLLSWSLRGRYMLT